MSNPKTIRVALVIVLYNPDDEDLRHALMMAEGNEGIIVDNSPTPNIKEAKVGKMTYHCFERNAGIAAAQNFAIKRLLENTQNDYTHFVLLDQDSRTTIDFPTLMAEEYIKAEENCGASRIAAIGPTIINKSTGETYKSAFHSSLAGTSHFIPQREIIASGMCIGRKALEAVGLNEEQLFIDMVDHEWCWRATAKGYSIGTTPTIKLEHQVGRPPLQIGRHTILTAAPRRYYYLCRNYILLVDRSYVPLQWKIAMGTKRLAGLLLIPLSQRDGISSLRYMLKGLWDGLKQQLS